MRWGVLNAAVFALCDAERVIAGFDDCAMVGNAIQQRGCHLGIAEDQDSFPELQICCDDKACFFIKLADEVEQESPADFGERVTCHGM